MCHAPFSLEPFRDGASRTATKSLSNDRANSGMAFDHAFILAAANILLALEIFLKM